MLLQFFFFSFLFCFHFVLLNATLKPSRREYIKCLIFQLKSSTVKNEQTNSHIIEKHIEPPLHIHTPYSTLIMANKKTYMHYCIHFKYYSALLLTTNVKKHLFKHLQICTIDHPEIHTSQNLDSINSSPNISYLREKKFYQTFQLKFAIKQRIRSEIKKNCINIFIARNSINTLL